MLNINKKNIINYCLFLYVVFLPFEEALASSIGSILKIFGMIIIFFSFFELIKGNRIIFRKDFITIMITLWILLGIISIFWVSSFSWWSYFLKIYISQYVLFIFISSLPNGYIDLSLIEKGFILGAIIAAMIMIISPSSSHYTDEGRRTIMLFGTTLDPNVLSGVMSLGLFSSINNIFLKKELIKNIIISLIIFFGILLTGSRGALIAIVVAVIIGLFSYKKDIKSILKIIAFLILLIIMGYFALKILPDELITNRFNLNILFGQNELASHSHSRYKIWGYALELIIDKPILGYGLGNFFSAIATIYRVCASHNMYILLMVEGGIIGFLIFLIPIFILWIKTEKNRNIGNVMLLTSILILAISLDSITYKYFWIGYLYVYLHYRQYMGKGGKIGDKKN